MSSILWILGPFININTDPPASFKAADHRSRYFCRLQLEHRAATHCSRDKHLARPQINKKRWNETIFLPCLVFLLRNKSVNSVTERLRWSRGKRAGLWYPSSRVQTRPKPSDFSGEKILSTPSFGGEVKPSVPCRKFTACKRTQKRRGNRHFRQNSRKFLAHSSTFRCWGSLASF